VNGEIIHKPEYKIAMKKCGEMGFYGLEHDLDENGSQLPFHHAALARIPFAAANIGIAGAYLSNSNSVIRLLKFFNTVENQEKMISELAIGNNHGVVCLTERHSNSSITDLR
jgi:alkylation response protein AidB-like acyl-CoA dehydrogenase